jgi:uncharacterized membrane protein
MTTLNRIMSALLWLIFVFIMVKGIIIQCYNIIDKKKKQKIKNLYISKPLKLIMMYQVLRW